MTSPRIILLLAVLAAAVYAPFLSFPFIANNFIEIPVSRVLASPAGFHALLGNPNWHFRITYALANSWLEQGFGFQSRAFYGAGICLHAICVLLIYAMGRWRALGSQSALWAAGFFAVYQAHHGPVTYTANWPDLLVTLFSCAAFVCWIRWVQSNSVVAYAGALFLFLAALESGESGFLAVLLLVLPLFTTPDIAKSKLVSLLPFVLLGVAQVVVELMYRPKPVPWENSVPMLDAWWVTALWAAGAIGLLVVMKRRDKQSLVFGLAAWLAIVLLADLFFTRVLHVYAHTSYLASVGLALIVGAVFSVVQERVPASAVAGIAVLLVISNVGVLWSTARRRMLQFAQPTQTLMNGAAFAQNPIRLSCFPYVFDIAESAAGAIGGQVLPEGSREQVQKPHCVSFSYKDAQGSVRQVFAHSAF